jgi:hypothetical protein
MEPPICRGGVVQIPASDRPGYLPCPLALAAATRHATPFAHLAGTPSILSNSSETTVKVESENGRLPRVWRVSSFNLAVDAQHRNKLNGALSAHAGDTIQIEG